jgi:hypothetical protein
MAGVYVLVLALVAFSGVLVCGILQLITIPTAYLAAALTYRDFFIGKPEGTSETAHTYLPIADPGA